MLRQIDKRLRAIAGMVLGMTVMATIGISAATGRVERSPECAQLARIVAARERTMLESLHFRDTELQAYAFVPMIRPPSES